MTPQDAQKARRNQAHEPPVEYDALWAEHGWGLTRRQAGVVVCAVLIVLAGSALLG